MAGSYPDVPAPRMAWDRDGSVMTSYDTFAATVATHSQADRETLNNEADNYVVWTDEGNYYTRWIAIIFPELRDLAAYWCRISTSQDNTLQNFFPGNLYTSVNTTNGLDGTWTDRGAWAYDHRNTAVSPAYRNNIDTLAVAGIKAVRFQWSTNDYFQDHWWANLHLFGVPSSGAAPNRLRFYDPTTATEVGGAYFDWGDIARGSTVTRDFRIHNPSSSLTANGVTVTMEALTDTSPTNVGQHEFSTDGGATWSASASVGNLAPGATSGVIRVRRTTSGSAALSLWATRMVASASSWS